MVTLFEPSVVSMEEDIFSQYSISPNWKLLNNIKERTPCPKCHKSRKFFCYTCYVPVSIVKSIIPEVKLPIKIEIIKHKREIDGKSTSAHAALLAPNDVSILHYPDDISKIILDEQTILIYPGKNSSTLDKYFQDHPVQSCLIEEKFNVSNEPGSIVIEGKVFKLPFRRAIFVDGTWNQSKAMSGCLKGLPCIVLQSRLSQFWRHQKNSPRWYLATIEAIHQLISEIYNHCYELTDSAAPSSRDFDNLLFFFRYMYHIIHFYYDHNLLLSYRRPLNL